MLQLARVFLAVRERDGHRDSRRWPAGVKPSLLQFIRLVLGANPRQIVARHVARGAMRVEINLSGSRVTDGDVGDLVSKAQARVAIALVEEGHEVGNLTVRQVEAGHPFAGL